jgi:di- and tripeptidase
MFKTPGKLSPVVYARFTHTPSLSNNTRRILFYGHYDVISADNSQDGWTTDPFRLEGIDGYLYGRGASDNKGPILAALYAAAELAATQNLRADIIFLLEGDEECGSRGFMEAVEENKHIIGDIDWILLANSYWLDDDVPCLTYGFRGVIHATLKVNSDLVDLHSGVNGSALMDEPLKDLVMLLSTLTGTKGVINIPGFYEPILPLTSAEERRYTDITRVLVKQDDALGDTGNLAKSLMCRWREPSLTIHRFKVSGSDNASVIPHSAEAAISIRLVPNQATRVVCDALIRFLQDKFQQMQSKNRLSVNIGHLAEPWLGDPDNELFRTLERAIIEVWRGHSEREGPEPAMAVSSEQGLTGGQPGQVRAPTGPEKRAESPFSEQVVGESHGREGPLYIREGGSISAVRFLEKTFNAPAANLACGQASDNAHLDQERLRLVNLYKSRDIFMKVFR